MVAPVNEEFCSELSSYDVVAFKAFKLKLTDQITVLKEYWVMNTLFSMIPSVKRKIVKQ